MCWTKLHNILGVLIFLQENLHQLRELYFSTNQFRSFVEGERNKNDFEEYGDCTLAKFKISQFVKRCIV